MTANFISETITPLEGFDPTRMTFGEPGVPSKFRWRQREFVVTELLEAWKDHGDCTHGSGERYVRKHWYRVRTSDGAICRLYFLRNFGKAGKRPRWWLHSMEQPQDKTSVSNGLSRG